MMMAWGMIGVAVLLVLILVAFLMVTSAQRRADKPKRSEKPKRDDGSRLILGDDGELVEITDDDDLKQDEKYQ